MISDGSEPSTTVPSLFLTQHVRLEDNSMIWRELRLGLPVSLETLVASPWPITPPSRCLLEGGLHVHYTPEELD